MEVVDSEEVLERARKQAKEQKMESIRIAREKVANRKRKKREEDEMQNSYVGGGEMFYQANGHTWRCKKGVCFCPEQEGIGVAFPQELPFIKRTHAEMLLKRPTKMTRKQVESFYGLGS